jgi:serine/threonine-protein kinase
MQLDGTNTEHVRAALQRILASPGFSRSERLCSFLKFVIERKLEGKLTDLKESVIGIEVFGREPGYDTHLDPVVRMEASKLRTRLSEYYAGPGAADAVRIEIPKGGYVPQWQISTVENSPQRRRLWPVAAVVLLILVAGAAVIIGTRPGAKPTIAVLPFLNLSSDSDNEYFSTGLADEITGLLSRADGVDVIARTSSFALKDSRLDARKIGKMLNATVLVEGSVQKTSDRMKVIIKIIRAGDGKQLLAKTYEREAKDVFATQEEIAAAIVGELRLKLGTTKRYTQDPEAYELYLRGRYAYDQGRGGAALQYFEQAVARDAGYASAYAGIASAVLYMQMQRQLDYKEAHRLATAAVETALKLDPTLSEGYTALGEIKAWDYAWQEAEQALRRAIELNPNNARARIDFGYYVLAPLGRSEEAVREVRRAQMLDPLSYETNEGTLLTLLMTGLYSEAENESRKGLIFDARRVRFHQSLARALSFQGKHVEAAEAIRAGQQLQGRGAADWQPGCVAAQSGQYGEAQQAIRQNESPERTIAGPNRRFFMLYACLGDRARALEYAEKMYAEREPLLPTFLAYPETAALRTDPGLAALRQRIGLPR